ncbi:MAG: hypothetical protein DME97_06155 [Verrucomicrobia bacterium]|nr:MAG: hypothetical protein DME97_06155 [Verrucomicrobiota bacterium]
MNLGLPAFWSGVTILLLGTATQAQEKVEQRPQPRQAIQDYLSSLDGVRLGKRLQLQTLQSDDLRKIFDRCEFLVLRYPRYPIEIVPVEPLRANNLFAVCDGKVIRISDDTDLKDFFLQRFPVSAKDEIRAAGVRGWLQLAQELHQDGFIKFGGPLVKPGGLQFEGAVNVTEGSGEGRLRVIMEFTNGRLSKLSFEGNVVPGTRQLR